MPLDQIRDVLHAPDAAARNQVIVTHMQRMESQLAATQSAVASLCSLLDRSSASIAVSHRLVSSTWAVAICEEVPFPVLGS